VTVAEELAGAALDGLRLDRAVALVADVSRSEAARLVAEGGVRLDGAVVTVGARRVAAGESLAVEVPARDDPLPQPDDGVDFTPVYEDADLVVVDKPAGLVVHPGPGHERGTLVDGLLARYPEVAAVGDPRRPGIVHRLDRGTSGLLVVARTDRAHRALVEQMRRRCPERLYSALVWGHPEASAGVIDAPVGRSSRNPLRMSVTDRGRPARTHYEVERRYVEPAQVSLLTCRLETGRTHQVRVHLGAVGHHVVGDAAYGAGRGGIFGLRRPFLHARSLSFVHPVGGQTVRAVSPLPPDLAGLLESLTPLDRPRLGG